MKRFLISLIACVCVSIGAWAAVTVTGKGTGTITISSDNAGDISSGLNDWFGDTRIIVKGKVNVDDLSAIISHMNQNWQHVTMDFSGLTEYPSASSWPKLWIASVCFDTYILPDGFGDVTDEMVSYESDQSESNGIFNVYDKLHYIIVPASGDGANGKLYVYYYKTDNWPYDPTIVSDISEADKTFFTGDESKIEVVPLNGAENATGWENLINTLKANETWGDKIEYVVQAADDEIVIDIENGGDLAAAIAAKGTTEIHKVTVTGGTLNPVDINALKALTAITALDISGAENAEDVVIPSSVTDLTVPANVMISASNVLSPVTTKYAYSKTDGVPTVQVLREGGFAAAKTAHAEIVTAETVKVKSDIELTETDLDYSTLAVKGTIDLSEAVLPSDVLAAKIKVSAISNAQANNIILPSSFDYDALDGFGKGGGSKGTKTGFVGLICSKDGTTLNAYSPESRDDQDLASLLTGVTTLNIGGKLTDGFVTAINGANSLENLSVHSLATLPTNNILTLTNTNLKGVSLNGLSSSSLKLNVDACSALQTVDLTSANINSVSAQNITTLTNVYANPVTLATKNTSTGEGCINVTGSLNDGMKISVDKDFDMERIIPTLTEEQVAEHVNQAGAEMKDNDGCSITLSEDGKTAIVHTNEAGHFATLIAKYQASFATGVTFKFDATSKVNADDLFALTAYYNGNDNKYFVDLFDIPVTAEMYKDGSGNSVNIEQVIGWYDKDAGTYTEGSLVDKLQSANKALRGILSPNNPEHVGTTIIKDADDEESPQATFNKFVAYSYIDMTTEKQVTTAHVYDLYKGKAACENNFNDLKTLLDNHSEIARTDLYLISTNSQSMIDISSLGTDVSRVEIYDNEMVTGSTRASITVYPKENTDGALKLAVDITGVENTPAERLTVIGAMSSDDFTALSSFTDGPRVLDLREATGFTAEMVASITNSNIEYILLPKDWEKNDVNKAASASGLSGLKAAISISSDAKELVGYLKQAGSLAEARCLWEGGSAAIGATVTVTKDGETQTYKTFTPTTTATLEKVTLSGSLNASDLGRSVTDQHKINIENGHLCSDATFNVSGLANAKATDNGYGTANGVTAGSSALNGETIKTLDLRDAVFENQYDMNFNMLGYSSCLENVSLPISADMTILPLGTLMGGSGSKIEYLCIPSNFKTIGRYALGNTTIRCVTTDNADHTVVIGANGEVYATDADAKAGSWDTFTLSSSLTSIGCGSFTPQSETITDVYVMATTTPKCEKDAFSSGMLYAWGGFDGAGAYCRDKYINGTKVATVLHFPEKGSMTDTQYETMKKNYTDINKVYTKKDQTGALDGNGNLMAWPSQNELYRVYNQASLGLTWNDWPVNYNPEVNTTGNCDDFSASLVGSGDVTVTAAVSGDIAPTKVGDYSFDDYIGWHQFVLSMATAYGPEVEIEIKDEKIVYRYVEDNWYTFCIPFDMTEREVIELLGVPASIDDKIDNMVGEERITSAKMPKIHTLKEVTRVKNGSMGTITLSTTVDLAIKDKDDNYTYYNPSTTNYEANTANSADKRGEKIVIRGGYPYLIKPYRKTTDKFSNLGQHVLTSYEFPKEASSVYRDGCHIVGAVKAEGADVSQLDQTTVVFATPYTGHEVQAAFTDVKNPNAAGPAKYKDGNETKDYKYRFMGQYWHQDLPLYSYYITGGKWYYYKTKKNGYYWKPYNCIINISSVLDETATTYYKIVGVDSKYAAKLEGDLYMKYTNGHNDDFVENENKTEARSIRIIFDDAIEEYDSEGNEVTAIESLDGQMLAPVSGKVYNMKGQYVGTGVDGLQKGIYIVNGKKIVVD